LCEILTRSGEFKRFPLHKNTFQASKGGFNYDNSKVQRELGLVFTPVEKSVVEMGKSLVELGIVKLPAKL